jgi:hypothetical protein
MNKYKDFIFEIQTQSEGFSIYSLKELDFIPHDEEINQDQIYLVFESLSNENREIIFEINLGVDVMAIFNRMVGHFKKTIRVECSEPEYEFSENSCIVLKNLINDIVMGNETFLNSDSVDSVKTLEPYYFNNVRFL